jgi:hypothetical protein
MWGKNQRGRRVTTLVDAADWTGILFVTNGVGGKISYRGYTYANEYEKKLAKLLHHQKIDFTPHVHVMLDYPDGRQRAYHPDFIFDGQAYVWTSPKTGKSEIIHGFEAKSRGSGTMEPEKKRLLFQQRRINVLIIGNVWIDKFYEQRYLPMVPFIPTQP